MLELVRQVHQVSGKYQHRIDPIIDPLATIYGVDAHAYYRIDSQGFMTYLSNLPEIAEYYFFHELYKGNPFLKFPALIESSIILPSTVKNPDFQHGQRCIEQKYQLSNHLLIFEREGDILHAHGFATTKQDDRVINTYLNHLDKFRIYCRYFREETAELQKKLQNIKVDFGKHIGPQFYLREKNHNPLSCEGEKKFFRWLNAQRSSIELYQPLSKREFECLEWIINGKSASQIAEILSIKTRTVEHYIDNIKNKLGCSSKSEIFSFVSTLREYGGNLSLLLQPWD